jgi:hypothetical protein
MSLHLICSYISMSSMTYFMVFVEALYIFYFFFWQKYASLADFGKTVIGKSSDLKPLNQIKAHIVGIDPGWFFFKIMPTSTQKGHRNEKYKFHKMCKKAIYFKLMGIYKCLLNWNLRRSFMYL